MAAGVWCRLAPDEQAAFDALQKLGAQVQRDESDPNKPVIRVDLKSPQVADADLMNLKEFPKLQALAVGGKVTDAGLAQLAGLTELQSLELTSPKITDAGLSQLKPLVKLQTLSLHGTKVTDAGLDQLQPFEGLQTLDLGATKITDAELTKLKSFKMLQSLDLSEDPITDAGLALLEGNDTLQTLNVSGSKITDAGLTQPEGRWPHLQTLVCRSRDRGRLT